jgi:hypothetical protein
MVEITSVGLLCTGSQFNVRRVNILHRVGYQMDIRNVSLCCISLLQDAIPVQHWSLPNYEGNLNEVTC